MPQSLREEVLHYAQDMLSTTPEALFSETPDTLVLRHHTNAKWYGIVMRVSRSVLGLSGTGMMDVLNVKGDPMLVASLRAQEGYLPAYHMNKTHWLSIRLDGSVPLSNLLTLLDRSYELTDRKCKQRSQA